MTGEAAGIETYWDVLGCVIEDSKITVNIRAGWQAQGWPHYCLGPMPHTPHIPIIVQSSGAQAAQATPAILHTGMRQETGA